jgi:hypothetical protein
MLAGTPLFARGDPNATRAGISRRQDTLPVENA